METIIGFLSSINYTLIWDWVSSHTDLGLVTILAFILLIVVKDKLANSLQGKKYEALLNKGLDLLSERMKDNAKEKQANEEDKAKLEAAWNDLKIAQNGTPVTKQEEVKETPQVEEVKEEETNKE